jgi:predicted short-subunit dehydrogenase-like oxidoreductase (DUF2520 family)
MKTIIAIIGAGRVAYSLTSALLKESYLVDAIISKKNNSAKALAEKFGVKKYSDDINLISKLANVFFLTVPDSEIEKTANQLSKLNINFKQSMFVHFSGAENINVLKSLKIKGSKTASIHLMQTFPSKKIVQLKNVHAAIETENDSSYKYLLQLSDKLDLIPFRIDSKNKSYYHLAGVFASNFLTGNLYYSKELLSLNNIEQDKFFNILSSTINSTLHNIKNVGPANALSGPVDRGDIKTIKNHLSSLKKLSNKLGGNSGSMLLKNYIVQSNLLLNLVEEKHGRLNKSHRVIKELLVQELRTIENSN